ncbi:hypothetical protein K505DRAFT_324988 [Melanomma pulvis-pyrius CBS 109.77]|uniref:Uncharacterized protein n=1 Tax=Melanomma pulvis-pyrius CBS 109.77 TaxID=1314802 RepID=A0A6A6XDH9_9PLEO|nr:hypothetical protein K505DRAFT_324988 [Melanomma pulvis-pyrius CBS 109.77]
MPSPSAKTASDGVIIKSNSNVKSGGKERADPSMTPNLKVEEAIATIEDEPKQIDAIKGIRGWFGPNENSVFYPIVQEYLAATLSLTETTKRLSEAVDEKISENGVNGVNYLDLFYSILHSAKRIPWTETDGHTKLVELVKRLKTPSAEDVDHFSGIPNWGMATREVLNDSPGAGAGYSVPEVHAWTNVNYFLARIEKERILGSLEPIYGLYALREALEKAHKDDGPNDAHKPGTVIEKYNAYVPAAAVWVLVLRKDLYELEKDMAPTNPNQGNPARGGELWKGKAEFSKERWALWKKRFGEIRKQEELDQETRDIAREAFEAMDQVDKP